MSFTTRAHIAESSGKLSFFTSNGTVCCVKLQLEGQAYTSDDL